MRLSQPHTAHTTILPLKTTLPNAPAKNPATEILFHITVNPVKTSAPAILWVRNPEEYPLSILSENPQNPFAKIVTHLQAHPLSYTLQEIAKPVNIDINSFTTIVLTSASAEYGIFTRQALLDYLSRGGTILYLANSPSRPNNDSVGRWLEALGMQLDTTSPLNGIYTANTKEAFMRHWKNVQIRNGTPIKVTDRNSILAAEKLDQNTAVAVTRTYGLGRVIAIASSTPFENNALKNPRSLRLAQSIFRHIADAANHRDDLDGDGIPDNIEDQNRNRRHAPGTTHFAPADTDGAREPGAKVQPHRGNWGGFMAHEVGMPGVYDMGPQRVSWLCRYITDWMGDDAFLVRLSAHLRRPNIVGDVTRISGRVQRKWVENGFHLVQCEMWAVNQRNEIIMPGSAVVSLPFDRHSAEQPLEPPFVPEPSFTEPT